MGGSKSTPVYGPEPKSVMPQDITGARNQLLSFLTGKMSAPTDYGTSTGSKAYASLMDAIGTSGGMPKAGQALSEMVSTGSPYTSSDYYKSSIPVYQTNLDKALADIKENYSVGGGTRSTPFFEAMGKGAGDVTNQWAQGVRQFEAEQANQAKARQTAMIPTMLGLPQVGANLRTAESGANVAEELAKYPWIEYLLKMATSYPPAPTQDMAMEQEDSIWGTLLGALIKAGGVLGGAAIGGPSGAAAGGALTGALRT